MVAGFEGTATKFAGVRSILLQVAYSNLWISLSAWGCVRVTEACLGLPHDARAGFMAMATMFMVYTFAKAIHFDPQADQCNDPERTQFLLRHRRWLIRLAGLLYGLALSLAYPLGLAWLCWLPFLTALLYDVKWLPAGWKYRRLKDIPGIKSLVVALTWAAVTVLFPVGLAPATSSVAVAWMLVWHTLLWLVNTIFFDVGDMAGDALEGTRTLPLVLGFATTRRLLLGLALLAGGWLWAGVYWDWLAPLALRANLVSLYSLAYVWMLQSESQESGFLCDVVADGIGLIGALALLV